MMLSIKNPFNGKILGLFFVSKERIRFQENLGYFGVRFVVNIPSKNQKFSFKYKNNRGR